MQLFFSLFLCSFLPFFLPFFVTVVVVVGMVWVGYRWVGRGGLELGGDKGMVGGRGEGEGDRKREVWGTLL